MPVPRSAVELVLTASTETKVVLVITAVFSLVSWFIIMLKWWQFRRLNKQADRFFAEMERTTRLQEAYHAVMKQPPSPYNRLFREAITFYSELRPGALREERGADRSTLTPTQLEALKMVLGKEVAAERDLLGHYIPWLATIGSVSPLLGLLGRRWIRRPAPCVVAVGRDARRNVGPSVAGCLRRGRCANRGRDRAGNGSPRQDR